MPDRGYRLDGWRSRDETRLRNTWRGLVMERLWESEAGSREWRNETGVVKMCSAAPSAEDAA